MIIIQLQHIILTQAVVMDAANVLTGKRQEARRLHCSRLRLVLLITL
jgi:hypothetical protein